jgi:putative ABC transport system ATP-binding protein
MPGAALPLILSVRSLRKDRPQGAAAAYSLSVPRLDVRLGDKLLITGPSGCGKSTLLDAIGMILRPDAVRRFAFFPEARDRTDGEQRRRGCLLPPAPAHPPQDEQPGNIAEAWRAKDMESLALWRRHVGYVLQTGGLLPFVSVKENILIPRRLLGPGKERESAALPDTLITALGIGHLLRKLPAQLSVGERQRAAIARALAADPPLVLADEPTAALDPANAAAVLALFSHMVDALGAALILVSHAPEQTRGMGFRHVRITLENIARDGVTGTRAVLADASPAPEDAGDARPGQAPAGASPGTGAGGDAWPR